jgi:hypothetical protein
VSVACAVEEAPEERHAVIRFHIGGAPIPVEDLAHLFGPFCRGKKARESGKPVSGLWLAISKEIVVRHGGGSTSRACRRRERTSRFGSGHTADRFPLGRRQRTSGESPLMDYAVQTAGSRSTSGGAMADRPRRSRRTEVGRRLIGAGCASGSPSFSRHSEAAPPSLICHSAIEGYLQGRGRACCASMRGACPGTWLPPHVPRAASHSGPTGQRAWGRTKG